MAQRLHETASSQGGYFTAKQALAAGYASNAQSYNVQAGNWEREHRGIYRLANYPPPSRPDLVLWSLWSANRKGEPQGIYSHATALSIYELSDLNPAKLHMTVPPSFRRNSEIPKALILHAADPHPDDVESMQGYKVTRPLRTISDLIAEGAAQEEHLRQSVRQALERGLISRGEIERAPRVPAKIKARIMALGR